MNAPAYRIDGKPESATAFYAVACDPARSVVVEACAGAGKTWMLVSRILRALLDGVQPQHILAITFTRKAAGEMRQRLHEWLTEFSAAHSTPAQRVRALCDRGLTPAQAQATQAALATLQSRLLNEGQAVEVRTFHGWFAQLLAHAPLSVLEGLGLPLAYEPIEDIYTLRQPLLKRFHRRVLGDAALLTDYQALVGRHRRSTLLRWLDAAWARGAELQRADAAGNAHSGVPAADQIWAECEGMDDPAQLLLEPSLSGLLKALARELGRGGKTAQKAASGLLDALAGSDPATAFASAWAALFTLKGEERKQLGSSEWLRDGVDALRRLQQMRLQQQAYGDHVAMLGLARVLLVEYAELKRQRGLIDMADLERAAQALLSDTEIAGWVQERLDQRVRQLLIDEFQDTSPWQWQVMCGWLSSYAGAGGGASGQRPPALFIVGDPKQSIYRFRGAEPRVFIAARDLVLQGLQGALLECDHTRRNAPAVIEAVNRVFLDAAAVDGWEPFRAHTTGATADGWVRRLPGVERASVQGRAALRTSEGWRNTLTQPREEPELRLRALEAQQAAAAVAALIAEQGVAPGDVMVLARQRSMLALVAQALAALAVPHVVADTLALHESPEALDLVAVLDVLVSPGHDLALARALRSPVFGASDDDLLWLAQRSAERGLPWLRTLVATPASSTILVRAALLFSGWMDAANRLPPHDLLDRIVHEGQVMARYAARVPPASRDSALHAIHALLAASLAQDGGRFSTVYGLVRELRAGRLQAAGVASSDAVQLLTVHGAKGLEARAVVVVDSDPERRPVERAALWVDWPVEDSAPRRVAFVRSASNLPPSLQDLWAQEQAAAQREEINGLYVAMTRAREFLVFSRTEPHLRASSGRPWWGRVEGLADPWSLPAPVAGAQPADAQVPLLPELTWQVSAVGALDSRPAAARAGQALDPYAARLGQAVHRVLEWVGRPGASLPRAQWAGACAAAAGALGLDARANEGVERWVRGVLDSPPCARFFTGPDIVWAGTEVPLSWQGKSLRVDRLVALRGPDGPHWWVLDYKLSLSPSTVAGYTAQLRDYVLAVMALQPGEPVHGAFITGEGELVLL